MSTKHKKCSKIFIIIALICLLVCSISVFKIIKWKIESGKTNEQLKKINSKVNISEIETTENTNIINQDKIDVSDPYWDYIKMNMIDVDFKELKKINNNVMGWLQVNGTNINYPFVQSNDNKYYLNHSFDKSYNAAGWVFLDYRNNIDNIEKNNIIYAHGRADNTLFGSLKNVLGTKWLNNVNNHIIKLSTQKENTLWQVFSVYRIPTTNDYLKIYFNTNKDFLNFANILINRSVYNFNTTINENDIILTLSTCYNKKDKIVLHAKLIKKEIK